MYTRAIIDAIYSGQLEKARTEWDNTFGLAEVVECPGVPVEVLSPRHAWNNESDYHQAATRLAELFIRNFQKFMDKIPASVAASGPRSLEPL
jgi:phosphoenolpyruvate carboxykinase (ATP)